MSIHVALHHRTTYTYDRLVALGPQIVRLRPAPHSRTPILSYSLTVEPKDHFINWQQDPQGNYLARLVIPEKTKKFEVTIDLVANMAVTNPFDFFLEPEAETYPFAYDASLTEEIAPFRKVEAPGPLLQAWLAKVDRTTKMRTIDFLVGLNARLQQEIGYIVRLEPGIQTFEKTLDSAKGSCRDTGWLLVAILRHLGFAARFASGYLIQLKPDEKPLEGPEGPTGDFTDLHAWCEVYLPGAGWIGLDPTSGLLAGEGHIPLACTPEPLSAAPIEGAVEKSEVEFEHEMKVSRVRETPRTTKPYTDEQWKKLLCTGQKIERDIKKNDLRLTMAASRPSCRSTTWMAPSGTRWRSAPRSAASRAYCSASSPIASPRARCCTSARANGIPENSCRAGRSAAIGARTARRSGATPRSWPSSPSRAEPPPRPPIASPRRSRNACSSIPVISSKPSRTPGTTCGASGGCRATSRSTPTRPRTQWNAPASRRSSRRVSRPRPARCCRSRACTTAAADGAAGFGFCARRSAT